MPDCPVKIASEIDRPAFIRFSLYDTFLKRGGWRRPAGFAAIFTFFALICFTAGRSREDSGLIGTVLLSVGLLLPAVYFFSYVLSLSAQAKKLGLAKGKAAYFLELSPEKVIVFNEKERLELSWSDFSSIVIRKGCIYLYTVRSNAYLIPECESSGAVKELVRSAAPEKVTEK